MDQARNLLLGMLGHDMRSPLNTIVMTAQYLAALNAGASVSEAASRLIRSGASMKALLDDLIDFNRTKLGLGIKVAIADLDLAPLFGDELEQLRGAHPSRQIELEIVGDTRGVWDGLRLQQLLRNLVVNAIIHGAADAPIHVVLTGSETDVTIEVKNSGPTIEKEILNQIFDPLKRDIHAFADSVFGGKADYDVDWKDLDQTGQPPRPQKKAWRRDNSRSTSRKP